MAQRATATEDVGPHGTQPRVEVVSLVTSAGGLEALSVVLRGLAADFPAAIVVGQHLGGQGSRLVEILARRTRLHVEWAQDGGRIAPGHVTVCPPRSRLEVLPDGTCAVRRVESVHAERPLDALLTSIGDSFGAAALAVVLTGMGTDGAVGALAVRAAGGVVIAQSEDTAEQPSMPRAVVAAGAGDLVLPLHAIGGVLVDLAHGKPLPPSGEEEAAIRRTFGEHGEVALLARGTDWGATPLGPVSGWPEAQRVVTRLAMDAPDGVTLYLGPQHVLLGNAAAVLPIGGREAHARVFGRPFAEAHPDAVDRMLPVLDRALAGETVRHERTLVTFERNGRAEDVWLDMSYTPIHSGDGEVIGVQQRVLDRSEEVLSGRRLRTLNRLATASAAPHRADAIAAALEVLADSEDVSFAALYLLDVTGDRATLAAACGVRAGSAMAPAHLRVTPAAPWPLRRALEQRRSVVLDDVAERFPGQRVGEAHLPVERAVLHPLRGDLGREAIGVVVLGVHPRLALDESYREFLTLVGETIGAKAHEAHARQRERERVERLAELDRAKTEFFSNVSHEFRTPLTLMLAPLEDLLHDADGIPEGRRADLELIARNARRLLRLVGTMLDFSQMEAGRLRARFAPVDLAERTREVVAQFEGPARRAGLELRTGFDEIADPVWVDAEMWEKVVSNLLSNALKFTVDGAVDVTLRALPKHVELVVRDTGVGIPEDELPHVFTRFHRVRDTRARTHEGAGIGLALVDELVRRHHGRVRALSTPGGGTTMTVWIPRGRRPVMPEAPDEPPPDTGVAAAMAEEALQWDDGAEAPTPEAGDALPADPLRAHAAGARVLVADDNRDMRQYLTRLLAPHWRVETAGDGTEALEHVRRDPPDLVLADVMMPGLDGFALLRALRDDPRLATLPVVLVTARAGEESAIEGLRAGADDYIVKPFSARELVARVGGQLELARVRRGAEALNPFLVGFSDAARPLTDPTLVAAVACRSLTSHLRTERTLWADVDLATGEYVVECVVRADGSREEPTRFPLEARDPFTAEHLAGRSVVYTDAAGDARIPERVRAAMIERGHRAGIAVPVLVNGALRGVLVTGQGTPRLWTAEEVAVVEALAGRAHAEIERARAEAIVHASEERYRTLVDRMAEGFVIAEVLHDEQGRPRDARCLEANRAASRLTGVRDLPGRLLSEAVAGAPTRWLDVFDRVARTGLAERLEHFAAPRGRRYDVHVSAAGGADGSDAGPRRVVVLFQDVTERMRAEVALRRKKER